MTDELPAARLPNGPVCTTTGVPSLVCMRFVQQDGHRPGGTEPARRNGLALAVPADHEGVEPLAQVGRIAAEREQGHHLAGGGDVEAGLAQRPVGRSAESDHDLPQGAVVDIEDAPPGDRGRVDAGAAVQRVVDDGG